MTTIVDQTVTNCFKYLLPTLNTFLSQLVVLSSTKYIENIYQNNVSKAKNGLHLFKLSI